jgi:hypothetical protein
MTYEYMTGMGKMPIDPSTLTQEERAGVEQFAQALWSNQQNGAQPVVEQPIAEQPAGWLTEEEAAADAAAHGRSEAQSVIQAFNSLITRVRAGDQAAMSELQDAVNHHDTLESLPGCRQLAAGTLETPPIDRQLYTEYCDAINLAIQVAEGNDPQRRRNVMIGVGVGGAVAVAALGYLLWRRGR